MNSVLRMAGLSAIGLLGMPSLHAGPWELGLVLASGQEIKSNVLTNNAAQTGPYTLVDNKFEGPWTQGGLSVRHALFQRSTWGFWLHGQYSLGLVHPRFRHVGENYSSPTTFVSGEEINGTASYRSTLFGVGLSKGFSFGEISLQVGSRSHHLEMSGRRETKVGYTFAFDDYSVSHDSRDTLVSIGLTLIQPQQGFQSFQTFSIGTGFGGDIPPVDPGPTDWKMREAYLARARPNTEFRFCLGVRL